MIRVFKIWRFVFMLGWAKSLLWSLSSKTEKRVSLISIHKISEIETGNAGYGFILGPITFLVGYANYQE